MLNILNFLRKRHYSTFNIRENSKINVLVHNDLDGTGCLYLISKVYGEENISFIKTNYKDFIKNFNFLVEDLVKNNKEKLIICDLSFNKNFEEKINLDLLEKVKGKILWLDHHKWEEETIKKLSKYGEIVVDTEKCATGVVYDYFKDKNKFSEFDKELVETICDFDLWKMKKEISWKLSLALMTYDLEKYRIEKLNKGVLFDKELEKKYLKNLKKVNELIKNYEKRGILINKDDEKYLLVFDSKDNALFISHVFDTLKEKYDNLILVTDTGKISMRGKKNVLNLAKKLGGGGHIKAAGALIDYPKFLRKINKILFKIKIYPKKQYIIEKILEK